MVDTTATRIKAAVFISLLALGGATAWWATRGESGTKASANAAAVAKIQGRSGDLTKQELVAALARQGTQEATDELVKSYVNWASSRETLNAREDILDSLYKIESLPRRLKAVLDAISGDKTPPEQDPLWNRAVDRMARNLAADPSRLAQQQDLMLMEKRARAQQLLATGMAQFVQSSPGVLSEPAKNLSGDRRSSICQDLIDVYFKAGSESYRRELEGGIEAACGHDAAIVLKKTANGVGPNELEILKERDEAIKQALSNLGKGESIVPTNDPKKH
jgi:hypothetical protein